MFFCVHGPGTSADTSVSTGEVMIVTKLIRDFRSSPIDFRREARRCQSALFLSLALLLAACASTSDTDCPDSQRSASGECRATGSYEWADKAAQEAQKRFEDSRPGRR